MPGSAEDESRLMAEKIQGQMAADAKRIFPLTSYDLLRVGGSWLGAARNWMQRNFRNGDTVIWGSDEPLVGGTVNPRKIEEVAAVAVAAYVNEDAKRGDLIYAAEFAVRQLQGEFDGGEHAEPNKYLALSRLQNALKKINEGGLS